MKTNTVSQSQTQAAPRTGSRAHPLPSSPATPSYAHKHRSANSSPTSLVLPPAHRVCPPSPSIRQLSVLTPRFDLALSLNPVLAPQGHNTSHRPTPLPKTALSQGLAFESIAFFLLLLASVFGLVQNSSACNSLPLTLHRLSDALRVLLP